MRRRSQALVGIGLLTAGVLCAYAGSVGAGAGVDWLADGAAFPAGVLLALAVVFLLRAALPGRARNWTYFGAAAPAAPAEPRHDDPPAARTLEILDDDDQDRRR